MPVNEPEEERLRSSFSRYVQDLMPGSRGRAFRLLLCGILATFVCGALIHLVEILGLVGAKPVAELLVAAVLLKIYPEKNAICWSGRLVAVLFSLGAVLALFWIAVFAWGNTIFPDLSGAGGMAISVGVLSAVFTAPIYEEKVVRYLLLRGVSGLTNHWVSLIMVSAVFALVHKGAVIWSFAFSAVLCWLALVRDVGTLQRAIIHGTTNSLIMLWYFTSGFGFFS